MKKIFLLSILLLFIFEKNYAQSSSYTSSHNMTATATAFTPGTPVNRSFRVRFEIQNDSITLIDSFISDQPFLDSFLHTSLLLDTTTVDYTFGSNIAGPGTPVACQVNINGVSDSIYKYSYRLFHKDSFSTKTIMYKGNYYSLSSLGTSNWKFTPDEYDADDIKKMLSFHGNIGFWMNQECPVSIKIIADSIFLQVARNGSSAPGHQLLKEEAYSTPDSFNLRLQVPCANLFTLDNVIMCYNIYVGDTATTTKFDIKMSSLNSNFPSATPDYWFHYDSTGTSVTTSLLAPLPASSLELSAKQDRRLNELVWSTLNEKNTSHFVILKSKNGIDFENIGSVKANANTDKKTYYNYEDYSADINKDAYYRIDLYDVDFNKTSSNIVFLAKNNSDKITISPNPTSDFINITGLENSFNLKISTIAGKEMLKQRIELDGQIDLSKFPAGIYLMQLQNLETQEVLTQKIMKE